MRLLQSTLFDVCRLHIALLSRAMIEEEVVALVLNDCNLLAQSMVASEPALSRIACFI